MRREAHRQKCPMGRLSDQAGPASTRLADDDDAGPVTRRHLAGDLRRSRQFSQFSLPADNDWTSHDRIIAHTRTRTICHGFCRYGVKLCACHPDGDAALVRQMRYRLRIARQEAAGEQGGARPETSSKGPP